MKKSILLILLSATILFLGKEVRATNEYYINLIDMNKIEYNSNQKVFYSNQEINLSKNTDYTFVATSDFFGNVTKNNAKALLNQSIGTNFVDDQNNFVSMNMKLAIADSGLYYSTIKPTENCTLKITDFLTKGYRLDNLPKSQAVLYKGKKEQFKGFREVEYFEDYEKVGDSVDIYTNYTNPIQTMDITNRIKIYDNSIGFYGTPTLVSDDYNNSKNVGVYELVYSAKDTSNNERMLKVNVNVIDSIPPTIEGPDIVEWDCYNSFPHPVQILAYYTAYDAIDGDVSDSLITTSTLLFVYQQGVSKDYEVTIKATDNAGNVAMRTIIVRSKDITPPTLHVKDLTFNLSEIGEVAFSSLFEQVVTEVSDNSGDYSINYEYKESSGSMGFSGLYEVNVVAKDAAGNETKKTAKIKIIDDIAPDFYLHTDLFTTTTEDIYTIEQIKESIGSNLDEEGIMYDSIELISCDYITNEKKPGTYSVKYAYNYQGKTNFAIGTITVESPEDFQEDYIWMWWFTALIPLAAGFYVFKKYRGKLYKVSENNN